MITLNDLTDLLGNSFFDGNDTIAGIVIYTMVLAALFVLSKKNVTTALILSLPVTLVFATLGILSSEVLILLIVVTVLLLAYMTRNTWRD